MATIKRSAEFIRGAKHAAALASEYNSSSIHKHLLEDCILGKMNIGRARPRKNMQCLPSPDTMLVRGMCIALAEMHRKFRDSSNVREVAKEAGITIASAKASGVVAYDWKELRRAGVLEQHIAGCLYDGCDG